MTNCPNCGAPIHGGICEYCGTEFDTIGVARINPKILPKSISVHEHPINGTNILYADNEPILTVDAMWYEYANQQQISAMIDEVLKRAETRRILHR